MPHSSRKRKTTVAKRREVVDEDGWTRVTKGFTSNLSSTAEQESYETVPDKDLTVEKMRAMYNEIEATWLASDSCKTLVALLKDRVLAEGLQINRCLIFGSGSFCGLRQGWIKRHATALCQLAVLRSMVQTIEEGTKQSPTVYAQEPCYNAMDKDFLKSYDVEVVDSPRGFELLDEKSLAYTAYTDLHIDMQVISKKPAIFLSSQLDWYYRSDKGQAYTARRSALREKEQEANASDPGGTNAKQELAEAEFLVYEAFLQGKDEARIPDFEYSDQRPFRKQYLYWQTGSEEGTKDQPQSIDS